MFHRTSSYLFHLCVLSRPRAPTTQNIKQSVRPSAKIMNSQNVEFQAGIQHGSAAAATATAAQPPLAAGDNMATGRASDTSIENVVTTLPDTMADPNANTTVQGHGSVPPALYRGEPDSAFLAEMAFLSGSSSTPPRKKVAAWTAATPSPPTRGRSRSLTRGPGPASPVHSQRSNPDMTDRVSELEGWW